jgi:glycosyltransferase involved in cell wall biosynthesis
MISFIVIGRNEGWKLTKCLESVFQTIKRNSFVKYEVIYVDSKSSDDSLKRAQKFLELRIFQLTGDTNAAIGRNVGAKEAQGDILYFIDADMELIPEFLPLVYSDENGLIQDFVSGNWVNYFYNQKGDFISKENYQNTKQDSIESVTGGLFLIKRKIWEKPGGMNPVFKKSQDIDLGLRLAKNGTFLHRKKEIAAKHNTIAYLDKNRMWRDLFSFNHLYGRSLLYRRHLFNKHMYYRLIRNDYTLLLLLIGAILFVAFTYYNLIFLLYLLAVLFRGKIKLTRFLYLIIRDLSVLLGFFFFWPKKEKNTEYIKIN